MSTQPTDTDKDLVGAFDVCGLEELKKLGAMSFKFSHKERGRHDVGVFWDGEGVYAIDDWCPHADGSLHLGEVHPGRVVCPVHEAVFDLTTGRCLDYFTFDIRAYQAEVRDGRVWVHLPDEEPVQRTRPSHSAPPPGLHS